MHTKRAYRSKLKVLFSRLVEAYSLITNYFFNRNILIKDNGSKWIYVSYITKPLREKNNLDYFKGHQNRNETLIIEQIINELGISYIVDDHDSRLSIDVKNFDYIFGLEPNFVTMAKRNLNSIKIYYATGCYFKHQNDMIVDRTNEFVKKHDINYPYKRLVNEHDSCEVADHILQIGSEHTVKSYPIHLRSKITLINQSSHTFVDIDLNKKKEETSREDYMWFGSQGSILKGLDLVVEAFLDKPKYKLHIIGPVDKEFTEFYQKQYNELANISFYGFLNIDSIQFRELANRCTFMIFPSGSEGGSPGSVINLQKLGVIPILSYWASGPETKDLGYILTDLSVAGVNSSIEWSEGLSKKELHNLITENHIYATNRHNLDRFKTEFSSFLASQIHS